MTFDDWAEGYGVIGHAPETRARIRSLAGRLVAEGRVRAEEDVFAVLAAADRLASATMWLVVHMTYATRVDLSGAPLSAEDFKATPEGHTGGSLNVAPAYIGYLAANLLSGKTRSWVLGQGHCVSAIEAANALVENLSPAQQGRYGPDEAGLSQLCRDFYSYAIGPDGRSAVPVGSHVSAYTAGAVMEGGYLGFAEIEYVHMPLPGESLVAILSDGAFEEQRGSDWSERWWRAEDCGLVAPILVLNGRRIEQRTEVAQDGGAAWLGRHLEVNGFDPIQIDGRDPAAYAWAILEAEDRLGRAAAEIASGRGNYPVRLPFVIASTIKGYGFPGAGTNAAHGLPLGAVPRTDEPARRAFNAGAAALHVPTGALAEARQAFQRHEAQARPKERDHALAHRDPPAPTIPPSRAPSRGVVSAMAAIDDWFVDFAGANPGLRLRVGNPDELASNQMGRTLNLLKHRVNRPEAGAPESTTGAVITALNEEAVIGAALGNKGGLNLAVSYEAFAVRMLGALRQEIIFARQQAEAGRPPRWIGVPLVATSHTWENGKNQQSHQDPTIGEALLGEMSDVSRVMFPVDAATAVEALRAIYADRGVVGCVVAPKRPTPCLLDPDQAREAVTRGAMTLGSQEGARLQFVAVGAYQLIEALRAAERLRAIGVPVSVAAVLEPGRLRAPRDEIEARFVLPDAEIEALFPSHLPRVLATHTRPEPLLGALRRIDPGPGRLRAHGYINRGGTFDTAGMLFANRSAWAHLAASAAALLEVPLDAVLEAAEREAIAGRAGPADLR